MTAKKSTQGKSGNPAKAAEAEKLAAVPDIDENFELSEQDQADLDKLTQPTAAYHTLLEIWRELLAPAEADRHARVGAGWASRITQMYPAIKVQEMEIFRDLYHAKIAQLVDILHFEISSDADSLSYPTPQEDAVENRGHYKNLLLTWQQAFMQWEHNWDCTKPDAHVEIAAISEVHKMFLGPEGVINHLDSIGFQFEESDQEEQAAALLEFKEGL